LKNYFTFPDGSLTYDCGPCGACCQGLGIGLDMVAGDLDRIEAVAPGIAAFVRKRGPAWTAFNPRGGCWFLEHDGLCRLEREHGRAHKPSVCRLFPFNRIFTAGAYRVVDFNSVVCPLEPATNGVRHADLLREIEAIADPAIVGSPLPPGAEALIAAEVSSEPGYDECPGLPALFQHTRLPGETTRANADLLLRSLRFNELFGPRSWTSSTTLQGLLPRMSRSWLHLLAIGEELAGRPLGIQEATSLWGETVGMSYVLARWNEPAWISSDTVSVPDDPDVLAIAKELRRNQRRRAPFGDIVGKSLSGRPLRERVVLTRSLEGLLAHVHFSARKRR
jgi:Fe-S-cluster containining protein